MRKERKQAIADLLKTVKNALHPDLYEMMTIGHYTDLQRDLTQAIMDLENDN